MATGLNMVVVAVAAVVVVVVVNGAAVSEIPKRCCTADQWSANFVNMSSVNSDHIITASIQMNVTQQRQAVVTMSTDTKQVSKQVSHIIFDYSKGIMYYMPAADPSQCIKIPYPAPATKCVPDDAMYLGSYYFGPLSAGLVYDTWRFKLYGDQVVTLALTRDDCSLLAEGIYQPSAHIDDTYIVNEFVPKLTDPSMFTIPQMCLK